MCMILTLDEIVLLVHLNLNVKNHKSFNSDQSKHLHHSIIIIGFRQLSCISWFDLMPNIHKSAASCPCTLTLQLHDSHGCSCLLFRKSKSRIEEMSWKLLSSLFLDIMGHPCQFLPNFSTLPYFRSHSNSMTLSLSLCSGWERANSFPGVHRDPPPL